MSKLLKHLLVVVIVIYTSCCVYAADSASLPKVYNEVDLADNPKLVVKIGVITDYGSLPFTSKESVVESLQNIAAKKEADAIRILSVEKKVGSNLIVLTGNQLHVTAEMYKFKEPSVENVKAVIHNKKNISLISTKSAIKHAINNNYSQLESDLIYELTNNTQNREIKLALLDGYDYFAGKNASVNLVKMFWQYYNRDISSSKSSHDKDVSKRILELLAKRNDTKLLYDIIVKGDPIIACSTIYYLAPIASREDLDNLRKLFSLHRDAIVRQQAGKSLIRLNDIDYVTQMLRVERNDSVVQAVNMDILRTRN